MSELPVIRPMRDRVYVQRIRETQSKGGILFPQTFRAGKSGHSARLKMDAVPDTFRATVLTVGPCSQCGKERHACDLSELHQGDEVIVYSYAEGDGSTLYTGVSVGEKDKMFIKPSDIVCAVSP